MYIIEKSYELMGYWTAKAEKAQSSKPGTIKKKTVKEKKKSELKKWIDSGMKPKEYRLKAQQTWGVTERTVLSWLKEIRDEETAILRNNADTAQKRC